MIKVSIPEYGPQLIKTLVGLILFDSIIVGAIIPLLSGVKTEVDDPPELELVLELVEAHEELFIVVLLKVIAPVWATTLPSKVAPPPGKVISAKAKTVPTIVVVPLNVADESTFQNTLQACAPPVRSTLLPLSVIRVDVKWKIKTELASPFKVRSPVKLVAAAGTS